MCEEVDTEFVDREAQMQRRKERAREAFERGNAINNANSALAGREMTIEEFLDSRIKRLHRQIDAMEALKNGLSKGMLRSGFHAISALMEP